MTNDAGGSAKKPTGRPTARRIFHDPSGGEIQGRLVNAFIPAVLLYSNGNKKEKIEFADLLIVLGLKFASMWVHLRRYEKSEAVWIEKGRASPVDSDESKPMRVVTAQDLYMELDEFLVQLKSTLDCMVKVLNFGMGIPYSNLTTFGDKGNSIANSLVKCVKNQLKGHGKEMGEFIRDNQEWLTAAIELRDRMNHTKHGGLPLKSFYVAVSNKDGVEKVHVPSISEKETVREAMGSLYVSMLDFVESFFGMALIPRTPGYAWEYKYTDGMPPNQSRWRVFPKSDLGDAANNATPVGEG